MIQALLGAAVLALTAWLAAPAGAQAPAELPSWAQPGDQVVTRPSGVQPWEGRYLRYRAVRERATGLHCLSVATADRHAGPFTAASTGPLACQRERGGTIDPDPFVDADGTLHLVFSSAGVPGREDPTVWAAPLTPDGLALAGPPRALSERAAGAAGLDLVDGTYVLLLVTGDAVDHAVCDGPLGPCRDAHPYTTIPR